MKRVGLGLLIGSLCIHAGVVAAEEPKLKISTGFDYSKGDYGNAQDTEIWYYPVTAKLTKDSWTAKLTVPYIRIKGPGSVIGAGSTGVVQQGTSTVTTESGLGDIIASLAYTFDLDQHTTYIDLTGKVKLPTASEKRRLGTGLTDYTARIDVTKMMGQSYVFAGVGRKFVGSNATYRLQDIWMANIGAGHQLTRNASIGVVYDYREAAGTGKDPSDASAYFSYRLTPDLTVQAYGTVGFSDGSPNSAVGLQFGYKFPVR